MVYGVRTFNWILMEDVSKYTIPMDTMGNFKLIIQGFIYHINRYTPQKWPYLKPGSTFFQGPSFWVSSRSFSGGDHGWMSSINDSPVGWDLLELHHGARQGHVFQGHPAVLQHLREARSVFGYPKSMAWNYWHLQKWPNCGVSKCL